MHLASNCWSEIIMIDSLALLCLRGAAGLLYLYCLISYIYFGIGISLLLTDDLFYVYSVNKLFIFLEILLSALSFTGWDLPNLPIIPKTACTNYVGWFCYFFFTVCYCSFHCTLSSNVFTFIDDSIYLFCIVDNNGLQVIGFYLDLSRCWLRFNDDSRSGVLLGLDL